MKPQKLSFYSIVGVLVASTFLAPFAHARGGESGGGGDKCQDRIEAIRNNISDWIQAGRSAELDFTQAKTSLETYNKTMQNLVALTRRDDQSSISCTDNVELVKVDGAEKTCKFYFEVSDPSKPRILCYRGQSKDGQFVSGFLGLSEEDQYWQVHHELAGLAGIEDQSGERTDYPLSDQVSAKLEKQVVKMLPIGPKVTGTVYPEVFRYDEHVSGSFLPRDSKKGFSPQDCFKLQALINASLDNFSPWGAVMAGCMWTTYKVKKHDAGLGARILADVFTLGVNEISCSPLGDDGSWGSIEGYCSDIQYQKVPVESQGQALSIEVTAQDKILPKVGKVTFQNTAACQAAQKVVANIKPVGGKVNVTATCDGVVLTLSYDLIPQSFIDQISR